MSTIIPPAQVITDTNKAGLITVVTTFFLSSVWICFCVRIYVRLKVNGPWKLDDYCIAAATVISTIRSAIVYVEISRGYGQSVELLGNDNFMQIGKAIFADNILYILTLFLSKYSVALLCQRLSPRRIIGMAIWGTIGVLVLSTLVSILLLTVRCNASHPWNHLATQCSGLTARWDIIFAYDVITEVILFCIPLSIVLPLQMSFSLKSVIILAFGIRLPVIAFAAARLSSLTKEISSADPTLLGSFTAAWTQVALDFSIIASTLSCIGAVLSPFTHEMGPSNGSGPHSGSYQLDSLASGNHTKRANQPSVGDVPILREDAYPHTAIVSYSAPSDRQSIESNNSKKGIIKKEVQWQVSHNSST